MGIQLSKKALEALKKELETLKTAKRKEIAERLSDAKSFGDLSENFEYQQAKDEQGQLEQKIGGLESVLKEAKILEHTKTPYIELGSRFEVKASNGKKINFELTSTFEADPLKGKISSESPLGKLFVGKKEGDQAEFVSPDGNKIIYEIKKISD